VTGPAEVRSALLGVYDPCSHAWNRPLSVVDLGLVRDVAVDLTGTATVRISLTAPFCMAVATIMQAVEQRVGQLPGISSVHVEIDTETTWSTDLMTAQGRRTLADRRAADRTQPLPSPERIR
jgi:metal-sulfur cluster biosynthetic enzyme